MAESEPESPPVEGIVEGPSKANFMVAGRNIRDIIRENCPVFVLHPQEKHLPCSIPWFLERAQLRLCPVTYRDHENFELLLDEGQVTEEKLLDHQQKLTKGQLQLVIQPLHRYGGPRAELNDVPVYVHIKAVADAQGQTEAYEINYITFYPFNGAYTVACVCETGDHIGDWEHVTARVDAGTGRLQGMWFNAHRNRDGTWTDAHNIKRNSDGRLIAYVALNGHGTYPWAGSVHRIFWFGNDVTSAKGPVWDPKVIHLLTPEETLLQAKPCSSKGCCLQPLPLDRSPHPSVTKVPELRVDPAAWLKFNGYWGLAASIQRQNWFTQAEPPVSRTYWQRVFHFSKEAKKVAVTANKTQKNPLANS